jgi:hypothetical protein
MSLSRAFSRVCAGIAWGVLLFCVIKNVARPLMDYDLWWQLACGREMLTRHVFLRSETFSHTLRGTPWINFEWLSQILLYMLFKAGGLTALWLSKTVVCLGIWLLTIGLLIRQRARGPWLWLLACVGFLALKPRLYDRVELASLLLFPLLTNILSSLTAKPLFSLRATPWVVGALMALWVNLHGGFLYGLILIGLFAVGARWSRQNTETVAALDRSFDVAMVATLINPFGPYVVNVFVEHWVQIMSGPSFIEEWATPTVSQTPFFWALFVVAFFALIVGFVKQMRQVGFWALAVFAFMLWGTRSIRNTAYAAILIPFFIADMSRAWSWVNDDAAPVHRWGWAASFTLLFFFARAEFASAMPLSATQENRFPFRACHFLKENGLNGTLYNTYHFGGAIEWALGSDTPVFMDGRYIFHPLLVEHDHLNVALMRNPSPDAWQRFLSRYETDMAISEYGPLQNIPSQGRAPFSFTSPNLMFPRETWALVYWDDAALVFLKRVPRFEDAIKRFEYTAVWPYNLEQFKALLRAGKVDRAALDADLKRNARDVPRSYIRQRIENIRAGTTAHVD